MWVLPAALAMMAGQTQAETPVDMPQPQSTRQIDFRSDPVLRFTVPVELGGQIRRFLVDTAAEKSGISMELVHSLGLPLGKPSEVIGFAGRSMVPTVPLTVSGLTVGSSQTLDLLAFARDDIGADGYLGMDSLRGHVLLIDFTRQQMFVRRMPKVVGWLDDPEYATASTKMSDNRLIFARASASRIRVDAILDTGSSLSVGNDSLKAELVRRGKFGVPVPIRMLSVTGKQIAAEYVVVDDINIGDVHISSMPIAFAGPEPFAEVGFADKPALLLGMDVLRQFGTVEVDFASNQVRFTAKGGEGTYLRLPYF